MSFLSRFMPKKPESVVLIDIGSASVAGAYAHIPPGGKPILFYSARVDITLSEGISIDDDMLRALDVLGKKLTAEGAPTLRRETGSGHIDSVLVSIAAPWQHTEVRIETVQKQQPFVFTRALLAEVAARDQALPPTRVSTGESVIATLLNGYETANPFGKKVKRANLVILSSSLPKELLGRVRKTLSHLYHTHAITVTAFSPVAYSIYRDLYPHQKDFIVLDVTGEATDALLVKRGLLVGVASMPLGVRALERSVRVVDVLSPGSVDSTIEALEGPEHRLVSPARNARFASKVQAVEDEWVLQLAHLLRDFSSRHALPRTLFLLADESSREFIKRVLNHHTIHALWLSDEPLSVVVGTAQHLSPYVTVTAEAEGDLFLGLLALFCAKKLQYGEQATEKHSDGAALDL